MSLSQKTTRELQPDATPQAGRAPLLASDSVSFTTPFASRNLIMTSTAHFFLLSLFYFFTHATLRLKVATSNYVSLIAARPNLLILRALLKDRVDVAFYWRRSSQPTVR